MKKKSGTRTISRSSKTGKFVSEQTARRRPATTVTEKVRITRKKK